MNKCFNERISFLLLSALLLSSITASAQLILSGTNYTQSFDSLESSIPIGWSVDTGCTTNNLGYPVNSTLFYNAPATNTGWASTAGRFKNVASGTPFAYYADGGTSANQASQTNRALGLRQIVATDARVGFVLAIANTNGLSNFSLSFSLQSLDSTSGRISEWEVDYALGSTPTTFIPATTSGILTTGGYVFSKNTINILFGNALDNENGPVYIRILTRTPTTGAGSRRPTTAMDDFNLSWSNGVMPANIMLLGKSPAGTNVSPSANELRLKFDQVIQTGSGELKIYKQGSPIPTSIMIPSSSVSIADSTAIINGFVLDNNSSYHVLLTSGSFMSSINQLPNQAITDSTYWTFSTTDTLPPTPPEPLTTLDETFTGCMPEAIGNFKQYNTNGTATWSCSAEGHDDNDAASINGGIATGSSASNEDWLISAAPCDFSDMNKPILSFWQKRKFEGNITRSIKISTDYQVGMIPSSASWTTLPISDLNLNPMPDAWSQIKDIDLSVYKMSPFYIAFTYTCGSDGAYELAYDDLKVVDEPLGISSIRKENMDVKVLGEASSDKIILSIDALSDTDLMVQIYDLNGVVVYRQTLKGKTGSNIYTLNNIKIPTRIFFIKVLNQGSYAVVKVLVK